MKLVNASLLALGFVIALSGCSSAPKVADDSAKNTVVAAKPANESGANPASTSTSQMASKELPPYLDPKSALSTKRSVYFDFDNFSVKKDYDAVLELHGNYLARNPTLAIRVEGNSDERGGTEYNLALGQKRADAVAKALRVYGVKSTQVEAVSWGEEKPKASGHDEAAWAENRRVDLVYPKQ